MRRASPRTTAPRGTGPGTAIPLGSGARAISTSIPNLKAPRTLQYSLGFEQGFGGNYSFGVTGLYKDTKDLIGWEIMDDGVYEEVPFTDPFTGNEYTLYDPIVFPTVRKGNTPGFTVDPNADGYWQKYWALILTFNRRFADFWSMSASYTYSESTGLIAAYLSQYQSNPLYGSSLGSRSQLVPQRRRSAAAGRPAAHVPGPGELRPALEYERQHHGQPAERPTIQPAVPVAHHRLTGGDDDPGK